MDTKSSRSAHRSHLGVRWGCPACGSLDHETLAWLEANRDALSRGGDPNTLCCPCCHASIGVVCFVTAIGQCLRHAQPFAACRREHAIPAPP